jgi:lysine-specific demethylase 8
VIEPIPRVPRPSVVAFRELYELPCKPVVITGAVALWPAMRKWSHEWFKATHGAVMVDLSVNPTHTFKVVRKPLAEYIDHILTNRNMGGGLYLDQYALENIPALAQDIARPPYCHPEREVTTNLWLGPAGTVVSFHKDNHLPLESIHNIFVQIRGRKRIVLAAPDQDALMYPRPPEAGAYWHSQIDLDHVDHDRFPLFRQARLQEAIVGPGDMLFIPGNYWHHVRALERSISLSFWWHPSLAVERFFQLLEAVKADQTEAFLGRAAPLSLSTDDLRQVGGPQALLAEARTVEPPAIRDRLLAALPRLLPADGSNASSS